MQIKTDIDYEDFSLFESYLTHELNRLSVEEFTAKFKEFKCANYEQRALLASVLNYINGVVIIVFKPSYYILEQLDYLDYLDDDLNLNNLIESSIPAFRDCGILYNKFGGFADGSYFKCALH